MVRSALRGIIPTFAFLLLVSVCAAQGNIATFIRSDNSTQGNWPSTYGTDGYYLPNLAPVQPSYLPTFAFQNALTWNWSLSTSDPRALRLPNSTSGAATTWYNSSPFSLELL